MALALVSGLYFNQLQNGNILVAALNSEKQCLEARVNTLEQEKASLQSSLNEQKGLLISERYQVTSLNLKVNELNQLVDYFGNLSEDVTEMDQALDSYTSLPESFTRVLNSEAILSTASAVSSATGSSKDMWTSEQKIFDYIKSNVKYAYDVEMPYISYYRYIDSSGIRYITEFTLNVSQNYVQTPGLTLDINQGDCDDQAVLAYAMLKYYMKNVLGTEYNLYLASMEFTTGPGHVAVIMPVQGGNLCIIDPAGSYLTLKGGSIASKAALQELQAYSNYWAPNAGSIRSMQLYRIDTTDGSHTLVAEGTIEEIAQVFN